MTSDGGPELWDRQRVAYELGVTADTVTVYASRSRRKVRRGEPLTATDLPVPIKIGRRSYWVPAEVMVCVQARGPNRRTTERWGVVSGSALRPGDIIDHDGQLLHVQIRRDVPTGVAVRVSARRNAPTGRWLHFRNAARIRRLAHRP